MKNSKVLAIVSLFVLLTPAIAQTGAARANVPFDFTVGTQKLAAGDYNVAINGSILQITDLDGKGAAHAMTVYVGGGPNQDLTPRLIFHRYGDRRFLAQVWLGEINQGHQLFASATELEYARNTKQESVTIAVSQVPK